MRTEADLARVYQDGQDAPRTGPVADLIHAYVRACEASYGVLVRLAPYRIVFVDFDPYPTAEHQAADVALCGRLYVYTGGSTGLRWSAEANARMRAVHDALDHLSPTVPFTFAGEVEAYRRAVDRMGKVFAPILWSEIVLQAAAGVAAHDLPQKIVIDPRCGQ